MQQTDHSVSLTCTDQALVGARLDKFLFAQFPTYSRSYFQELIDKGHVLINQMVVSKSNHTVKQDDHVTVTFKTKQYNLTPAPVAFDIVDEQKDFLIINKPAGLLVHHSASTPDEISLVNGLLYKFKELEQFDDNERPGIVHRLDKNTSGLLIVARNQEAHIELVNMFKSRSVSKTYVALVNGHPPKKGKIEYGIGRHPTQRHKMSVIGIDARPALTYYDVLASYTDCTLVAAKIVTGRTHQIRVHFAEIDHGLVGDGTYGHKSKLIDRQALHSWKMAFEFRGKQYSYCQPIPEDFKNLLAIVNKKAQ